MKKVFWMQDFDIMSVSSGAELTDREIFMAGIARGNAYDMILAVAGGGSAGLADADDLIVVSNSTKFSMVAFDHILHTGCRFVFFFHDFWPLCTYRLYYPMLERCKHCPNKSAWLPVWRASDLLVWMSPLHREAWLWACPELEDHPYALVPSAIRVQDFPLGDSERKDTALVVNMVPFKGSANVLEYASEHPDIAITVVGGLDLGPGKGQSNALPANITHLGSVPHFAMPELYRGCKWFLSLPGTPQPFERVVTEAYLSGCELIVNENVGALSYDWFHAGRDVVAEHVKGAPDVFWGAVEGIL